MKSFLSSLLFCFLICLRISYAKLKTPLYRLTASWSKDMNNTIQYEINEESKSFNEFSAAAKKHHIDVQLFANAGEQSFNYDSFRFEVLFHKDKPVPKLGLLTVLDSYGSCGLLSQLSQWGVSIIFSKFELEKSVQVPLKDKLQSLYTELQKDWTNTIKLFSETLNDGEILKFGYNRTIENKVKSELEKNPSACKASGTTMSTVLIDYENSKVYCANVGDSPIYIKLKVSDDLIPFHETHKLFNKNELKRWLEIMTDGNEKLSTEVSDSKVVYSVSGTDGIQSSISVERSGNDWNWRVDQCPVTRSIGHLTSSKWSLHSPTVMELALRDVDYIIVASSGLTDGLPKSVQSENVKKSLKKMETEWTKLKTTKPQTNSFESFLQPIKDISTVYSEYSSLLDTEVAKRLETVVKKRLNTQKNIESKSDNMTAIILFNKTTEKLQNKCFGYTRKRRHGRSR